MSRAPRPVAAEFFLGPASQATGRAAERPPAPRPPAVADLRAFARLGGCPWREPCGCLAPRCRVYGGETTPARCVDCLTGRKMLSAPAP